jgi:hypothetical protein
MFVALGMNIQEHPNNGSRAATDEAHCLSTNVFLKVDKLQPNLSHKLN